MIAPTEVTAAQNALFFAFVALLSGLNKKKNIVHVGATLQSACPPELLPFQVKKGIVVVSSHLGSMLGDLAKRKMRKPGMREVHTATQGASPVLDAARLRAIAKSILGLTNPADVLRILS